MTGRFRGMYLCKRGLNRSEFAPPRFTIILNRRFNYGYGLWTFVAPIKKQKLHLCIMLLFGRK